MKKLVSVARVVGSVLLLFPVLAAAVSGGKSFEGEESTNVVLGKPVTLHGEFGVSIGSPYDGLAAASTITDGLFLPESTWWQEGSVWWDENHPGSVGNAMTIELQDFYQLASFTVQVDNNDFYRLEYRNAAQHWVTVWEIPEICCFGLMTRTLTLPLPIRTDALRLTAISGDLLYSVSEIQAFPPMCDGLRVTLMGTPGHDVLLGTDGDDVIAGLDGNDTINGRGGDDVICGGRGHDVLIGGPGQDTLFGEAGNDTLQGGDDNDILFGGPGNDTLSGGDGIDLLSGEGGNDSLEGGKGTDVLLGGLGNDTCTGGAGENDFAGDCEVIR